MATYDLTPVAVKKVKTRNRCICTMLPVPESIPIFDELKKSEPRSMAGQPPIIWHKAEGFNIYDKWGNKWIDWSSGVLIANAGHGRREIGDKLKEIIDQGLLATYVFVHEGRVDLVRELRLISPDPDKYQVFLLSTGSEATENCIKLAKTYGLEKHGPTKNVIVSFENAFHGRTLGSQLAGGMPKLKKWIGQLDQTFVQIPFPDGFKNEDTSFELFLNTLKAKGVDPKSICGVISESYQGVGPDFFPVEYARKLESFCRKHDIVLIMDEVQAGFGRTGKMFTYQHYGISPDLVACGKGITSSLPLSAVIGRSDIMSLYPPGSMTSTHSASPLAVVSALENLRIIKKEKLVENAEKMGGILISGLEKIQKKYSKHLGCLHGKGLVAGLQAVKPGTKTPDPELAQKINVACYQKGLLMFAPVGIAGECIKIAPPLCITKDALDESLEIFGEAVDEVLA
ncbi:MAG TPA: aspartate aminotransferase family protein [Lentisphaeria bacterium]|nr:MAG: 4-aminobutyrate aminotransferase [Lentisphaerae bacterium GWF2_50_93]HCE45202.1 aspartate aminotransferase family protein [Lentisphaeria bacterium]